MTQELDHHQPHLQLPIVPEVHQILKRVQSMLQAEPVDCAVDVTYVVYHKIPKLVFSISIILILIFIIEIIINHHLYSIKTKAHYEPLKKNFKSQKVNKNFMFKLYPSFIFLAIKENFVIDHYFHLIQPFLFSLFPIIL